jgi:hypothetical protein
LNESRSASWLGAEPGQKGKGGVTSVNSILIFLLSSVESGLLSGDKSSLFTDFSG